MKTRTKVGIVWPKLCLLQSNDKCSVLPGSHRIPACQPCETKSIILQGAQQFDAKLTYCVMQPALLCIHRGFQETVDKSLRGALGEVRCKTLDEVKRQGLGLSSGQAEHAIRFTGLVAGQFG
jgi:hypothetical protein